MIFFSIFGYLFACRSEDSIKAYNSVPLATITSHSDGAILQDGYQITFVGQVSDPNHSQSSLLVTWSTNQQEHCSHLTPQENGETQCDIILTEEDTEVRLQVVDPEGGASVDSIAIVINPTETPTAEIVSPSITGSYYADLLVVFEGIVGDAEDDVETLDVYWESSLDGLLPNIETTPNSIGEITGFGYLSEGEHAITVHVTDSTNKTNSDSVVIRVGPPNTRPSCTITAPQEGSAGPQGDTVHFTGTAQDPDIDSSLLQVSWNSDKDGVIGSSIVDSQGRVSFSFSGLSVNTHNIAMTVEDEVGATCIATVNYTVGTPPSITIDSPLSGFVYEEGESIHFQATVSDGQDQPHELTLDWAIDGSSYSTIGATSSGIAQWFSSQIPTGTHILMLTATDQDGLTDSQQVTFTVNGIPSTPSISIAPAQPTTTDSLAAIIDVPSVDPEGSSISYTYEWFANNIVQTAHTTSIVPASDTQKEQVWRVRVTPSDGTTTGGVAEAEVIIANTVPTINSISITPSVPLATTTSFSCQVSAFDIDGETPSIQYIWRVDNVVLEAETSATLQASYAYGQQISCEAIPSDTTESGSSMSASVSIQNTPPLVTSIALSPTTIYTNEILSATMNVNDPDSAQNITANYAWHVIDAITGIDTEVQNGSSASLDGTLYFNRDDEVYVVVTPYDGIDTGVSFTSTGITVANSAPSSPAISISPNPAIEAEDDLTCTIDVPAADIDADVITYTFTWFDENGASILQNSHSNLLDVLSASYTSIGTWTCTVMASDGVTSTSSVSAETTVETGCSLGEYDCPALSCADILNQGASMGDGMYWIYPNEVDLYEVFCDMTTDDGGWTRILRINPSETYYPITSVPNAQEFVDSGSWIFSKTMLKNSNREVMYKEVSSPYRRHRYDFKQGSNLQGEDFVGAVTGDKGGAVGVWNYNTSSWQLATDGQCNNNNHTQWNCEPPTGVRFHHASRDWMGNGGQCSDTLCFTGYAIHGASNTNFFSLVANWNGSFDVTAHDLFVR